MLSRVANAVHWMSRYMERAENVARVVDVNLILALDYRGDDAQWGPLVSTTGDDDAFGERYAEATRENVVRFLAFDAGNPNSILSCAFRARENARSVREILSSEVWEHVNRSYLGVQKAAAAGPGGVELHDFFTRVKMASHLFAGLMHGTMSHGEAWHFGRLGRLLERADKTSRILDVKSFMLLPTHAQEGGPLDDLQWSAVLRSASALEMYRKKKRRRITPRDVADFLVLDPDFPRSVHSCVTNAEESLRTISGTRVGSFQNDAEKRLGRLRARLDFVEVDDVLAQGLHEFLQEILTELNGVGNAIHESFFASRPIAAPALGGGVQ